MYCKVILLFVLCTIILTLKISSTGPYLLSRLGVFKIIEPALAERGNEEQRAAALGEELAPGRPPSRWWLARDGWSGQLP